MATITFRKGTGKKDRASFVCGKSSIPAAVVTRLLKELEGKPETTMMRIFIKKLAGKHDEFLDALDKAKLTYPQAIQEMEDAAPKRASRKPRIAKEALAVARMLCRKYSNQDAEGMLVSFLETVGRPEFKALVTDLVNGYLGQYGRNKQGKIRVRAERKGADKNESVERANRARAAKGGNHNDQTS